MSVFYFWTECHVHYCLVWFPFVVPSWNNKVFFKLILNSKEEQCRQMLLSAAPQHKGLQHTHTHTHPYINTNTNSHTQGELAYFASGIEIVSFVLSLWQNTPFFLHRFQPRFLKWFQDKSEKTSVSDFFFFFLWRKFQNRKI